MQIEAADIPAPKVSAPPHAARVIHGRIIPPQQQILLYSPDEWEGFTHEWVHYKKASYQKVVRLSGATDLGIDVAGLCDASAFNGTWDNYQCKHYNEALTPSVAIPEIAKMLWHSFQGAFAPPRAYAFVAPKGCGISLQKLLLDPAALKARLIEKWDDWCADAITSTMTIALDGAFRTYVDDFDFSIFGFKTALEILDDHRNTPYHAARFGGGLPDRPKPSSPPATPATSESRYLKQLFDAYGDHRKTPIADLNGLNGWPDLIEHYGRQREFFYHAESLRNFARDNVPPGTFEDLQAEVYAGVADVTASPHADALARVNATTQAAAQLSVTANGLIHVTKVQDKRGICHQLANEDRLTWLKT